MSEPDTTGRCISCGFLTQYRTNLLPNDAYQEARQEGRGDPSGFYRLRTLYRKPNPLPDGPSGERYLICYRRKAELLAEVNALTERDPQEETVALPHAVSLVLKKDRRCPHYIRYKAGLSPKDHFMDRRLTALEEDRQKFQVAIEAQNMSLARQGRNLAFAALIVGSLIGGAQVLTMTSESVLYRLGAAIYRRFVPPAPPAPQTPQTPPTPFGGI